MGTMSEDSDDRTTRDPSRLSPSRSPQPAQPKWAWWVVGILVPVVGIIVTLIVSQEGSSSPSSGSQPQNRPSQSSDPSTSGLPSTGLPSPATTGSTDSGEPHPKVRFGPKVISIDLPGGQQYIDFDSTPPLVTGTGLGGSDVIIGAETDNNPDINNDQIAPLPPSGSAPSEAECAERVRDNSTYTAQLVRGSRFCTQTGEGRTVYLRTVATPVDEGTVRLEVTVWEIPS